MDFIKIINKEQLKPGAISAMICQLNYNDFKWEVRDGHYFIRDVHLVKELLNFYFSLAIRDSIDLIVFPELGVPESLIEFIQGWTREHVKSVIAGSHYYASEGKYYSRCPIILNGEVHFTEKIYPAPIELSPVSSENLSAGREFFVFRNSTIGDFAVFICSDFLNEKLVASVLDMDLDFFCICAFQKNSETYFARMNIYCDTSNNGLYILYNNFISKSNADGRSSLFGLIDPMYADKLKSVGYTDLNVNSGDGNPSYRL